MANQPLAWLDGSLAGLERDGLRRFRRVRAGLPPGTIDFGSNDYLGLAGDPRLAAAAAAATASHGWGAGASPVVSGRTEWHERLEARLAEFEGTAAAIVFPSGYAANAGVIPALVEKGDALYADGKNHASLIDGCRLARSERFVFPHGDLDSLADRLREHDGRHRRRLIVTDGLFSMDGDFARLAELSEIALRHGAMLLVDEAHATGVWGPHGRGAADRAAEASPSAAHAVEQAVCVRIGTLSKAFGSAGGFVAGPSALIDWLHNRARPYVFSTASPPALAAASCAAIDIVAAEPHRRALLAEKAALLRARLRDAGWDIGASESQIVPVRVGDPDRAVRLSERLASAGLFVPAIRPPSVPEGESLVRVSVSLRHTAGDLERLAEALGPNEHPA